MDTLQNIDSDGNINTAYYKNAINELIDRYIIEFGYDKSKLTSNNLLAICRQIYHVLFEPQQIKHVNSIKTNIPISKDNIIALMDIYRDIALIYNCLPSMYTFCCLTGLNDDMIYNYVTDASSRIQNTRKEYLINRLNESNIGVMTLANNEQSIGLMYNRQNIIDHATVKQSLNVNDLVKLPQNE